MCYLRTMNGQVAAAPIRYVSQDEDSARWDGFSFRPGDIVISTRSKSGTTWMQRICSLLVFKSPDLPAPIAELSPWLDHLVAPAAKVYADLAAQSHRRFIKTHTPLDGVPLRPEVTYIVVARQPLDAAVSLYHQGDNLNRDVMRRLSGQPEPTEPPPPRPSLHDWLVAWVAADAAPQEDLDSIRGYFWHLTDAWRRHREPNIVLIHYDDLRLDLEGEMRRLASRLGIEISEDTWPELTQAATFATMRAQADDVLPTNSGIHKSSTAFFRRGTSGAGREELTHSELARYRERAAELAPADLLAWLNRFV
jgi:aryl sulfotransferase